MPPTPRKGRMANDRTMMPMPPIQWVRLRQNRMPRGRDSTSVSMLASVVVKPDMVSKKASVYDGMAPENTKGKAPKAASDSHENVTTAKPSFGSRS